ncbi:hypothetical protein KAX06_02810 [candidate division WOR-3 bacterium]|nr:hypothetical protein [candidate division WOR-3 bacterium]
MKWRSPIVFPLFVIMISCVAPVYHKAEVVPSKSLTVSAGPVGYGYIFHFFETTREVAAGGYIDISGQIAKTDRFAWTGHLGGVVTQGGMGAVDWRRDMEIDIIPFMEPADLEIFPLAGIGFQYELLEEPSFSARVELDIPMTPVMTLLVGIDSKTKDREVLTTGFQLVAGTPSSVFLTWHPTQRLHLTLGANPMFLTFGKDVWSLHAGIGYTIIEK